MEITNPVLPMAARMPSWRANSYQPGCRQSVAAMKARQSAKIREIGETLVSAGVVTLDEQAKALGVGRSTAWSILKNGYKNSGISAAIIGRILSSPRLPPAVNAKSIEYVKEKVAGLYGHGQAQRRKFIALVAAKLTERARADTIIQPQDIMLLHRLKSRSAVHGDREPKFAQSRSQPRMPATRWPEARVDVDSRDRMRPRSAERSKDARDYVRRRLPAGSMAGQATGR